MGECGWSPRSGFPEKKSREIRVSPLQLPKSPEGNSGGTAEIVFRPERSVVWGVFYFRKRVTAVGQMRKNKNTGFKAGSISVGSCFHKE